MQNYQDPDIFLPETTIDQRQETKESVKKGGIVRVEKLLLEWIALDRQDEIIPDDSRFKEII